MTTEIKPPMTKPQPTKTKVTLNKTRNTLGETIRRAMVELLNQQLADACDFGLQIKQAHWNVKGPNFISLHELFDKVAEEVEDFTDLTAERAVQLGGVALGTLQAVVKHSRMDPYPLLATSGQDHVVAVSNALAHFGKTTRLAIEAATKAGDAGTADVFTEISRGVDKLLWMVEAHGQAKD
jgi:starvation-inducible DNA-binding protein